MSTMAPPNKHVQNRATAFFGRDGAPVILKRNERAIRTLQRPSTTFMSSIAFLNSIFHHFIAFIAGAGAAAFFFIAFMAFMAFIAFIGMMEKGRGQAESHKRRCLSLVRDAHVSLA